jgi:hypothetical protein
MGMISHFSDEYVTLKALSLVEMNEANINIPRTILINSKDIAYIDSYIKYINSLTHSLEHIKYSIRLSFSDVAYPHNFQVIVDINNIEIALQTLLNKAKKNNVCLYDIICQPLFGNVMWSGGIVKRGAEKFIELVYGAGKTIFREGQYIYRYLRNGLSEFKSFGNQNMCLKWHDGCLAEEKLVLFNDITQQQVLNDIVRIIDKVRLIDNRLYEFGIVDGRVVFFECKALIKHSYENLEKVFTEDEYLVIDTCEYSENILFLDLPRFDYIDQLNSDSIVFINGGSILSHLAFYCAQKRIPCKFKTHS